MWKRLPGMKSRGFICRPVLVLADGGTGSPRGHRPTGTRSPRRKPTGTRSPRPKPVQTRFSAEADGDTLAAAETVGDALAAAEAGGQVLAAADGDALAAAPPLAFAVCVVVL